MNEPAVATPPQTAAEITRASKSNLALAFVALPPERRADISLFYAFCRLVDDITDDPGFTREVRAERLDAWRRALREARPDEPPLAANLRALIAKYALPVEPFEEIIMGCEMDIAGTRYATWDALRLYCYRVASAVGLVSIEIFGCRDPRRHEYATQLGLALQLTNILRDVGDDLEIGRIYLPSAEMERFGYTLDDLQARRHTPAFVKFMRFQADRAIGFYEEARRLLAPDDRKAAIAAEIMRAVYQKLLVKMRADGFRVFNGRYRVSTPGKMACVVGEMLRAKLGRAPNSAPRRG
jgi:phytoene synthase